MDYGKKCLIQPTVMILCRVRLFQPDKKLPGFTFKPNMKKSISQSSKRVFFALLPDESTRQKILQFQQSCLHHYPDARPVAANNFHITLHFIGQVDEPHLQQLKQAVASVQAGKVDCLLDKSGYFARPKVFWLGCSHTSDALQQLVILLGKALQNCDYQHLYEHYIPHVSLLRKFSQGYQKLSLPRPEPIHFQADQFVLMESLSTDQGVKYQPIQGYTLG